jgi:hypothetical protein
MMMTAIFKFSVRILVDHYDCVVVIFYTVIYLLVMALYINSEGREAAGSSQLSKWDSQVSRRDSTRIILTDQG